jgi:hypothetical protein
MFTICQQTPLIGRAERSRRRSRTGAPSRSFRLRLEPLEDRRLLSQPGLVSNSADYGPGSLRQAIYDVNNVSGLTPGVDTITFDIPTSDPGYDPTTNSWTIAPSEPLPRITNPVSIDPPFAEQTYILQRII